MRHENSVFHDLLKRIPWTDFDRLVTEHDADRRVRSLSTKSQFIALLYGQFSGAVSLREIAVGLESHAARLYHVGGRPVRRSTLADANASRSGALFGTLFAVMVGQARRGLRRKLGEATYLIDSTSVRLSGLSAEWARFSSKTCGAKAHIIYDAEAGRPIHAVVTAAKVNDISVAQAMPIEPGATYVFDLGYYDYAWWARLDAAQCRIVTRLKANTKLETRADLTVPEGNPDILCDRIGLLPLRQARNRTNPFSDPVREVQIKLDTGKVLRILSNDLDASAREIADLYKRRWAIELFFRWIKQTLQIRHFLGTTENAVRIQIAVALIAYLLLHIAKAAQTAVKGDLAFSRLVKANLMHRKRIDRLISQKVDPISNQLVFQWP